MDVVAACPDVEWLQDLMKGLIDGNNGDSYSQDAVESCEQLAKCISEKILKPDPDMDKKRLVACFTTLLLIGMFFYNVERPFIAFLNPYWQISGTFLRPFYWKTHPSKNHEYLFSF